MKTFLFLFLLFVLYPGGHNLAASAGAHRFLNFFKWFRKNYK